MSVQRIVEETPLIELQSENQYTSTTTDEPSKFNIRFEQIYLSKVSLYSSYNMTIIRELAESLGEGWHINANDAE